MVPARIKERTVRLCLAGAASLSAAAVAAICVFLAANAIPALREIGLINFLFSQKWQPSAGRYGALAMVAGTAYVTAGAAVVGIPPGVLTAVYLACFCPKRLYAPAKSAVRLLAGIPSVIYGFFGLTFLVPIIGSGLMCASVILGIMIMPTVAELSESALRSVDPDICRGAMALGRSYERSISGAVVPAAAPGIISAAVMGICRAAGETMAVVMLSGNSLTLPDSLLGGVRTLTGCIALEMGYASGLHRGALLSCAAALTVFILITDISCTCLKRRV